MDIETFIRDNILSLQPELHRGAFVISNDFDDLLPNDFWSGEA